MSYAHNDIAISKYIQEVLFTVPTPNCPKHRGGYYNPLSFSITVANPYFIIKRVGVPTPRIIPFLDEAYPASDFEKWIFTDYIERIDDEMNDLDLEFDIINDQYYHTGAYLHNEHLEMLENQASLVH